MRGRQVFISLILTISFLLSERRETFILEIYQTCSHELLRRAFIIVTKNIKIEMKRLKFTEYDLTQIHLSSC